MTISTDVKQHIVEQYGRYSAPQTARMFDCHPNTVRAIWRDAYGTSQRVPLNPTHPLESLRIERTPTMQDCLTFINDASRDECIQLSYAIKRIMAAKPVKL